jgi:hypothetical protein
MSEPLNHILRSPLPWRDSELTECGKSASQFAKVVTRDEAVRQHKEMGMQRFALFFCMTCISTANRWTTWDTNPIERLSREGYGDSQELATRELKAIAVLVAAHREEFDDMVTGLSDTTDLQKARRDKTAGRYR